MCDKELADAYVTSVLGNIYLNIGEYITVDLDGSTARELAGLLIDAADHVENYEEGNDERN